MVTIVSSVQDGFRYYDNLAYLRNGVEHGNIQFQGLVDSYAPPAFVIDQGRIYDFTRSAKAAVREEMTTHLCGMLPPGLQQQDSDRIRAAFDCIFDYYVYKYYLSIVGQQQAESMQMLVFNPARQYVAHVQFSSNTIRTAPNQFTVHITLTCQRFTPYFAPRGTAFQDVLQALQNLHV